MKRTVHWLPVKGPALLTDSMMNTCFSWADLNDPTNLFITDRQGKNEKQLTHLNEELIEQWLCPSGTAALQRRRRCGDRRLVDETPHR